MSAHSSSQRLSRRSVRRLVAASRARMIWAPIFAPAHIARCAVALARNRLAEGSYELLDERGIQATRRGDTVFVFGAGRSILDIGDAEFRRIAEHETVGFSTFHRRPLVRVDYHLVNEVADPQEYARSIEANGCYSDTIFVVQGGWLAHRGNEMVGRRLFPRGARLFRYRRIGRSSVSPPSTSFGQGLTHGANSSFDAVNFALLMGWRRIVLVGIDLYDRQYFFLPEGEATPHPSTDYGPLDRFPGSDEIVATFRLWRSLVEPRGVELLVYNPRSLLAEALDVFCRPEL